MCVVGIMTSGRQRPDGLHNNLHRCHHVLAAIGDVLYGAWLIGKHTPQALFVYPLQKLPSGT